MKILTPTKKSKERIAEIRMERKINRRLVRQPYPYVCKRCNSTNWEVDDSSLHCDGGITCGILYHLYCGDCGLNDYHEVSCEICKSSIMTMAKVKLESSRYARKLLRYVRRNGRYPKCYATKYLNDYMIQFHSM